MLKHRAAIGLVFTFQSLQQATKMQCFLYGKAHANGVPFLLPSLSFPAILQNLAKGPGQ